MKWLTKNWDQLKWVVLFLVVWFLFAFVFFIHENSFVYTNPTYDPAFKKYKKEIIVNLCNLLSKDRVVSFRGNSCHISFFKDPILLSDEKCEKKRDQCGYDKLVGVSIEVGNVKERSLEIRIFNFVHFFTNALDGMGATGGDGDLFELKYSDFRRGMDRFTLHLIEPGSIYKMEFSNLGKNYYRSLTHLVIDKGLISKEKLNFSPNGRWFQVKTMNSIPDFIGDIGAYVNGTPVSEPNFLKMLYFSGVTILTIGYGDIAPLSWSSRGFAILEGFLGIFILGLFVASFYDRLKANRQLKSTAWNYVVEMIKGIKKRLKYIITHMENLNHSKSITYENTGISIKGSTEQYKTILNQCIVNLNSLSMDLAKIATYVPIEHEKAKYILKALLKLDEVGAVDKVFINKTISEEVNDIDIQIQKQVLEVSRNVLELLNEFEKSE